MVIKYQISKYPDLLEPMVVKIWEAQSDTPGAEVYTLVIPERDAGGVPAVGGGHNAIYTVTANGLDKVVHIVRLFSQSGTLLHQYNQEPKTLVATIFDPIYFKIGDGEPFTPAVDDDTYTNPILIGLLENEYTVHRNNYGFLHPGIGRTNNAVDGSWQLIPDDRFSDGEEFMIQMQPKMITSVVNDSVVAKWFAGFVDISVNTDYINDHMRKLIRFTGTCEYTFPALTGVPIGYGFCFQHFGAAGIGKVKFLNGPLRYTGADKTEIEIPNLTQACFSWDGVKWNVVYLSKTDFYGGTPGIPAGTILGTGRFNVGDVPPGDPAWAIVHNKNIVGDYNVFISIMTNNGVTYAKDNKIGYSWWHDTVGNKANSFNITLQEITGEVQNISIVWLLVKN